MRRVVLIASIALTAMTVAAPTAHALQAGAGRSDLTPPTGFYTMGYVRSDAVARGQHTRLYARAIVLQRGHRKLALVSTDLGETPGGMVTEVAKLLAERGFSERNILISASHTHSGPAGFSPFTSDNFVAPTQGTPTQLNVATDRQLYGFLIDRVAQAIVRADADREPARAGWGSSTLLGITHNRSLEALLANFGKDLPYGTGTLAMVPGGYRASIDPRVDVLRVDRVRGRRTIPLGAWLDFADHGTVDPYTFGVYSADHTGPAARVFEAGVRREGHVPAREEVVGAYGNSDAGDMSAGLGRRGPARADEVGAAEARAMLRAWRAAGRRLSSRPALDWRWTRICFCGRRDAEGHAVSADPWLGLPFLTGSEENRGPLFDLDRVNHEGNRLPAPTGPQGDKIAVLGPPVASFATSVPLMTIRVGDGLLASVPGEMTVEMGRRTRAAVLAAARPLGVRRVVIAGYANEYLHYFVTPEEYGQQHYEGGSTLYGTFSSNLIRDGLTDLAARMARGEPAPAPDAFDPTNGVVPDTAPYQRGPASATALVQPPDAARLTRATFAWQGGLRGFDRPLDRPFVSVEERAGQRWRTVADDLGVRIIWRVDDAGRYDAQWQVSPSARTGHYRFVVTANRYGLRSRPFRVVRARTLHARLVRVSGGRALVALDYPPLDDMADLVSHPRSVSGGYAAASVAGRPVTVRGRRGLLAIPLGGASASALRIAAGAAGDRFGNVTATAFGADR